MGKFGIVRKEVEPLDRLSQKLSVVQPRHHTKYHQPNAAMGINIRRSKARLTCSKTSAVCVTEPQVVAVGVQSTVERNEFGEVNSDGFAGLSSLHLVVGLAAVRSTCVFFGGEDRGGGVWGVALPRSGGIVIVCRHRRWRR